MKGANKDIKRENKNIVIYYTTTNIHENETRPIPNISVTKKQFSCRLFIDTHDIYFQSRCAHELLNEFLTIYLPQSISKFDIITFTREAN